MFRPLVRFVTDSRRLASVDTEILRLLPILHKQVFSIDSVILDLGANRGDFSKWALKRGANVYAFEPNGVAVKYIAKRLGNDSRFHLLQMAVSNSNGIQDFFVHPNSKLDPIGYSIRSSLKQMEQGFYSVNKCLVINILDLFTIFTKIDLIKIDVEGAEKEIWPILRNHWHQINYLLLEVHDGANPSLRQEMNKFIQDHKLESRWSVQWN